MSILMGWSILAVGMLAASLPVIIHLLHRQRTRPVAWGAMQFLLESPLRSKRRKRVENWLLLAVRTAALLLLAWALARPLLTHSAAGSVAGRLGMSAATSPPTDVAVVLDHSLSTGRHNGDHTVFDEAKGALDQVARALRPGDSLSVVLAEHRPRAVNSVPVGARDTGRLLQAVHALPAGLTDCSIPEAVLAARQLLGHGRNVHKLILVVSDEQKANWQIGDGTAWSLAVGNDAARDARELSVHALALPVENSASNISIGDVTIEPRLVGINRPVQITTSVTNYGPKEVAGIDVHLTIDGQEVGAPSRIATLGVGQSTTLQFSHTFSSAGSHWARVWTDVVDALAADNSCVAAAYVWQRLPVLIIDGQLTRAGDFSASRYIQAAMQPVDPAQAATTLVQPKIVSAAESASVNLDDYYVVVLNDVAQLPPEVESRLIDYADAGHGIWVILGPRATPAFITDTLGPQHARLTKLALAAPTPRRAERPPTLEIRSAVNPMISMIASWERNALAGAAVTQWWAVEPRDGDDQVVIATAGGDPLVFEHPVGTNGGRVAVWATPADGAWNNWPAMPNFVPLVNETIYHLSEPQTRTQPNGNLPAGAAIAWSGPADPQVDAVEITLPDGLVERDRKPTFRNGRWEFQYPNAFLPGLYQLRFEPSGVPQPIFYGVSIDRKELDPTSLASSDRQWLHDHRFAEQTSADRIPALISHGGGQGGAELWTWMAGLVVASLVLETAITYHMIGHQKNAS